MSESGRIPAFLDASVLYPALLRNILIRLAIDDLYRAFWSERVQSEWTEALLRDRPYLARVAIERTRRMMEDALEGGMVSGYDYLIETISLPDVDDRHVLAAAMHCGARVIVTANLRDFPRAILGAHDIEAQHPDAFIFGLLTTSREDVLATLRRLRQGFNNPPLTLSELLAAMKRQGLSASAEALGAFANSL